MLPIVGGIQVQVERFKRRNSASLHWRSAMVYDSDGCQNSNFPVTVPGRMISATCIDVSSKYVAGPAISYYDQCGDILIGFDDSY